jgi:hypothetical protein
MTITEMITRLENIELDGKGSLKIVVNGKEVISIMLQTTSDGFGEYLEIVSYSLLTTISYLHPPGYYTHCF